MTRFFCRIFFFIAYGLPTITLKNVYKLTVDTHTSIMDLSHYIVRLALTGYYIIDKPISQKEKIVKKIIISKDWVFASLSIFLYSYIQYTYHQLIKYSRLHILFNYVNAFVHNNNYKNSNSVKSYVYGLKKRVIFVD